MVLSTRCMLLLHSKLVVPLHCVLIKKKKKLSTTSELAVG
jgi:hypothetical protein